MAFLKVNLSSIIDNIKDYSSNCMVIPVLKCNAYGLGAIEVMNFLITQGINLFACSKPEEALSLANENADILLLSCVHNKELAQRLAEANIILSVESLSHATMLSKIGIPVRVHIAIDTGFGRFGFSPNEIEEIKKVFSLPNIIIHGIFSHFRTMTSAKNQFSVFQSVLSSLDGFPLGIRHIAATLNAKNKDYLLDAVRIGTGYTGVLSNQKKSAQLCATIVSIHNLPAGSTIGYSGTKLKKDTTVAIIDIGTVDGAFIYRSSGPRTWLKSRKQCVKFNDYYPRILGTPGSTHTAIDVTGIVCQIGDVVSVFQTPLLVSPSVPKVYY